MAGKQETRDDQETRASLQPNDSWEYSPSRKESEAQAFETLELERSLDVAGMNDDVVIDSAEAVFCGVSLPCKGRKRFLLLCAGAILSAIGFAALQEGVWRVHGFHYSGYMTLLTAATMASCGQLERLCTGDTNRVGSLKSYLKLSLLTLSGMYFTNWSLQFLNYPTRVLFKSSKLVPTMTMGTVMQGRRYSGLEYVAALGLIAGATLFILGDAETKPDFEVIGVVLIVCGVCADAATSNYEEREFFRVAEPASQPEVMTFASLFGSLWALLLLLPSSELGEALAHSAENPSVVPLLLSSAVCGYVSVSFVLLLINLYGATVTEVVKSMRKILTVTLSFVLYPKPFSAKYALCAMASEATHCPAVVAEHRVAILSDSVRSAHIASPQNCFALCPLPTGTSSAASRCSSRSAPSTSFRSARAVTSSTAARRSRRSCVGALASPPAARSDAAGAAAPPLVRCSRRSASPGTSHGSTSPRRIRSGYGRASSHGRSSSTPSSSQAIRPRKGARTLSRSCHSWRRARATLSA